jgi:Flp pilus assembly protein CpaB
VSRPTILALLLTSIPCLGVVAASRDLVPGGVRVLAPVPAGMRVIRVPIGLVAGVRVAPILPRDRVDVLFTAADRDPDAPIGGGSTTTLLQNVEVLALDPGAPEVGGRMAEAHVPRSATLLVTPDQANKIDLARRKGTLLLVPRGPEHDRPVHPHGPGGPLPGDWQQAPARAADPGPGPLAPVDRPLRIRTLRVRPGGEITSPAP